MSDRVTLTVDLLAEEVHDALEVIEDQVTARHVQRLFDRRRALLAQLPEGWRVDRITVTAPTQVVFEVYSRLNRAGTATRFRNENGQQVVQVGESYLTATAAFALSLALMFASIDAEAHGGAAAIVAADH